MPLSLTRILARKRPSCSPCRVSSLSTSAPLSSEKDSDTGAGDKTPRHSKKSTPFRGSRKSLPRNRKRVAHSWYKPNEVNVGAPWSSVWPGPRPFDPYVIPFPIRMGRPLKGELPPPALGNLELMKIPNFFHLTPPAIMKHCEALKPLCTPWPERLPFMPLRVETRSFVFPSHSVKHSGSKQVTVTFKLSDLGLSERARNKMIHLAGKRYKSDTNTMRLHAARCPTRAQNMEYAMYLLKVLYLESNKLEPWEEEGEEEDSNTTQ